MDPTGIPQSLDDILKLGQVPVGVMTLYILYQIMVKIEKMVSRIETVLEIVTRK